MVPTVIGAPMPDAPPNILVLVWDAARAENFSVLGYAKPTTPNLERHAPSMALYSECICAATWTLPSIATLFSGTYPSTHRLVIDGDRLDERFASLPEMLSAAGYHTSLVTGEVPYVSEFSGLDRGFQHIHAEKETDLGRWKRFFQRERPGADPEASPSTRFHAPDPEAFARGVERDMAARASWKGRLRYSLSGYFDAGATACLDHIRETWKSHADQPKFIYAHLQETHAEYRPPHKFRKRFLDPRLRRRNFAAINQRPNSHAAGLVDMSEDDFEILTGLYDGCIAYLDEQVGLLLDDLSQQPDWDNTLVIITADHGDCLGRHGILGHQFVCYEELVRIPWLVKWPKSVGLTGHQDTFLQTVDLLPTLCGLLGLEVPAGVEGIDFLHGSRDVAFSELLKPFSSAAVAQGMHELAPQYARGVLAARSRTHKLISYSNGQAEELYDLVRDPREQTNLLAGDRAGWSAETVREEERLRAASDGRREHWKAAVAEIDGRIYGGDASDMTPQVEAQLRALGYLD